MVWCAVVGIREVKREDVCRCTRCICMMISALTLLLCPTYLLNAYILSLLFRARRDLPCYIIQSPSPNFYYFPQSNSLYFSALSERSVFFLRRSFAGGFSNVMIFPSNSILPATRYPPACYPLPVTHRFVVAAFVFNPLCLQQRETNSTRFLTPPIRAAALSPDYVICPEPIDNRHFYMKRNAV